jgi:hypothetical protein
VPFVLRSGRRPRWYPDANIEEALKDLIADVNNKISVWHIEDDYSNLNRVISALATSRHEIENFDYILIGYRILSDLNIMLESMPGTSADEEANRLWHRNLCDVTGQKRRALAQMIKASCGPVRLPQKDVAALLADGIIAGHIDRGKMRLKASALMKLDKIIESRQHRA